MARRRANRFPFHDDTRHPHETLQRIRDYRSQHRPARRGRLLRPQRQHRPECGQRRAILVHERASDQAAAARHVADQLHAAAGFQHFLAGAEPGQHSRALT
jgi:hypothetical protein